MSFFSCDISADAIKAQKATLFPGKYQRWVIVTERPVQIAESSIRAAVGKWITFAGLGSINFKALKVLGINTSMPQSLGGAVQTVAEYDALKSAPFVDRIFIAIEFYYDGSLTEISWPWVARGFVIQCPEDVLSGLLAVMPAISAMAPPTVLEELEQPLRDAAIAIDEGVKPLIDDLKNLVESPLEKLGMAATALLFGGVGILLYNLSKSTSPRRAKA